MTLLDLTDERKSARETCVALHSARNPKADASRYEPSYSEIEAAVQYRKHMPTLLRTGRADMIEMQKASLSAFSFGSNDWLMPAELSSRIIDCLSDPTDLAGLVGRVNMSSAELRFPINSTNWAGGPQWSCENNCFQSNPTAETNFGTLAVRSDPLRFVVCLTRSLLEDSSLDIEGWIVRNAERAFRDAISAAILVGDSIGKPLGFIQAAAGIPICETSPSTPVGQISWQDLLMLRFELPPQFMRNASFLMNQRMLALLASTTDANSKPIMISSPIMDQPLPQWTLFGAPIHVVTQMPDTAPGAVAVAYGDWEQTYVLATRKSVTVYPDLISTPFCPRYYFEARIGAGTLCPNGARLLRVK